MKTKVKYINKKTKFGFIGMNKFAAKSNKVPFKYNEHTIEVYTKEPKQVIKDTIHHEELEEYLMKNYHFDYHRAHKNALRYEKYNKPLPNKNIKKFLEKIGFKII